MRLLPTSVLVSGAALLGVSSASAGPLSTNPFGLPGFTGSVNFAAANVSATMDYAVFAPGAFGASGGTDPSGGTQYVYAYQVFATGSPFTSASVGLVPGSIAFNDTFSTTYPLAGGTAPAVNVFQGAPPTSFFNLWSPAVGAAGYSAVLLFTSPQSPIYASASVANGAFSNQQTAPSPLPEPTSLVLLGIGSLFALRRR